MTATRSPVSLKPSHIGIARKTAATAQSPRPVDGPTKTARRGLNTLGGHMARQFHREGHKRSPSSLKPEGFPEHNQRLDTSEPSGKSSKAGEKPNRQLGAAPEVTSVGSKRTPQDTRQLSKSAAVATEPRQPAWKRPLVKSIHGQRPFSSYPTVWWLRGTRNKAAKPTLGAAGDNEMYSRSQRGSDQKS